MISWGSYMGRLISENRNLGTLRTYSRKRILAAVWPSSPSEDIYQSYYRIQSHPIGRKLLSTSISRRRIAVLQGIRGRGYRNWLPCGRLQPITLSIVCGPHRYFGTTSGMTRVRTPMSFKFQYMDMLIGNYNTYNCPEYAFNWLRNRIQQLSRST